MKMICRFPFTVSGFRFAVSVGAFLLMSAGSHAAANGSWAVLANVRRNSFNATATDCPFDKDFSYGASFALYDGAGYIEAGLNYAPDSSIDAVDEVWTPFARIVFVDQFVGAGIGIRGNYVVAADGAPGDDEWSDLLYELYVGLEVPFGSFVLGGGVYYTFDDWSDGFKDFEKDYLEYGVHVGFRF